MSLRRSQDGSFWIPRRNKALEAELDLKYDRVPNELKWVPRANYRDLEELRPQIEDQVCSIVGKGPSLDKLRLSDIPDGLCFCINESIRKLESLLGSNYCCVTQDPDLASTCLPKFGVPLIINRRIQSWYFEYPNLYTFENKELGIPERSLTAAVAIAICKRFNASEIKMLCFDSCVNGNLNYAPSIGYSPVRGGDPRRFLEHRQVLERTAGNAKLDWYLPQ